MKHTRTFQKAMAVLLTVLLALSATALGSFAADDYDLTGATRFVFSDSGIAVTAGDYAGYKVSGTALTINAAGTYVVSGACANGSIKVKKGTTGVVLVLGGLTLTSSSETVTENTAPLLCNKSTGVTIVVAAGTTNTLTDSKYNNDELYPANTDDDAHGGSAENAVIKTKAGSNVTICGTGTLIVNAYGKTGIKGSADQGEGTVPTFDETSVLTIKEATITVTNHVADTDAIKAEATLNILSGNITVNAIDDGIKSDFVLNIGEQGTAGPTINVAKATEGIEASTVNVYSGNVTVNATDDGINAANGDIAERSQDFTYNQYGGYVYINVTNGDGIDSNGSATLSGGTLEVYAPAQGDGDPIDTEYGCTFSGATVLAVGHAMMQQSYSGTYVAFRGSGGLLGGVGSNIVTAGKTISIKDDSGNVIYTAKSAAPRNASYVVFTSSAVQNGTLYSVYNGESNAVSSTATTSSGNQGGQLGGPGGPGGQRPGQGGIGSNFLNGIRNFFQRILAFFRSLFGIG